MELAKDNRSREVNDFCIESIIVTCCIVCENGKVVVKSVYNIVERRMNN